MRRFFRNLEPVEKFMILVIVVGLIVIACLAAARSGEKQAQMFPTANYDSVLHEITNGSVTLPKACYVDSLGNLDCGSSKGKVATADRPPSHEELASLTKYHVYGPAVYEGDGANAVVFHEGTIGDGGEPKEGYTYWIWCRPRQREAVLVTLKTVDTFVPTLLAALNDADPGVDQALIPETLLR